MPRPVTEPGFRQAIALIMEGGFTIQQVGEAMALAAVQRAGGDYHRALTSIGYTNVQAEHSLRRILGPTEEAA